MRESSKIHRAAPEAQIPLSFDTGNKETNGEITAEEQEVIKEGLKRKDFIHPREGQLFDGKETTKIVDGETVKAWWRWNKVRGVTPQWIRDIEPPIKATDPALDRKISEQEADAEWERKDNRGGAY